MAYKRYTKVYVEGDRRIGECLSRLEARKIKIHKTNANGKLFIQAIAISESDLRFLNHMNFSVIN